MKSAAYTVLIPARLASTRLPNKPLLDIGGLPMVVRVAKRLDGLAIATPGLRVVVACDHTDIQKACEAHGVQAILTQVDHACGSDRLAEACTLLKLDDDEIVVNVQGDEPLIEPGLVQAVADLLHQQPGASLATAAHLIHNATDFHNPNVVKVVLDARSFALYFSRAPIPCARDLQDQERWSSGTGSYDITKGAPLRHIGLYAYRASFLRKFPELMQAPHEKTEALEQLRAMWHGYAIAVHVTEQMPGPGVDTASDLERVRRLVAQQ